MPAARNDSTPITLAKPDYDRFEPGTELITFSPAAELDNVNAALARNAREFLGASKS